jgi:hypothetical protein
VNLDVASEASQTVSAADPLAIRRTHRMAQVPDQRAKASWHAARSRGCGSDNPEEDGARWR